MQKAFLFCLKFRTILKQTILNNLKRTIKIMNEQLPEFDLEQVLSLLTSINEKAKNIKTNILEIQVDQQKVIIESLRQQ